VARLGVFDKDLVPQAWFAAELLEEGWVADEWVPEPAASGITGNSSGTVDVTGSAAGSLTILGSSSQTSVTITGSAAGSLTITGNSSATSVDVTGSAAGTVGSAGIFGNSSGVADVTGSASGGLSIAGNSAVTVEITGSATGTTTSGPPPVPPQSGGGGGVGWRKEDWKEKRKVFDTIDATLGEKPVEPAPVLAAAAAETSPRDPELRKKLLAAMAPEPVVVRSAPASRIQRKHKIPKIVEPEELDYDEEELASIVFLAF
jgi:hypothetical protein